MQLIWKIRLAWFRQMEASVLHEIRIFRLARPPQ